MAHKEYKSTCRMCHGGCGVILSTLNNRLTDVAPAPDCPTNRGSLCPKGLASMELVYNEKRLKRPLKQTGERGSGNWKEIAWHQAISEIGDRVAEEIARHGPQAVACGQGTGRHHYLETIRFAHALGTPNVTEPGAAQCYLPRVTVSMLTYGDFPTGDYYGKTSPECLLFWGANPVVTGPDGKVAFAVSRAISKARVTIAIDPVHSATAAGCMYHLQIRPGSDCALALAMINVIVSEDLFDREFVDSYTSGFAKLAKHVSGLTPEWAAPVTWISPEQIRTCARLYATTRPGIMEWGVSIEQTPNSLSTVQSLAILRALTGNIDVPGGELTGMHILRNRPINISGDMEKLDSLRLGADRYKLLGGRHAFIKTAHAPTLFNAMLTHEPYPVTAFLVFGNNPLATYASPKLVMKAMLNTRLLVMTDLFMTPSAELADYVLPAAAWPEVNGTVGLPYMAENIVLPQQKVVQTGECRSDEHILFALGQKLGLDYERADLPEALDRRLARAGITFAKLCERGWFCPEPKYRKYLKRGFRTPSRKVELHSSILEKLGYPPLPRPPETHPDDTPDDEYPLILITGRRNRRYFHSEGRQIPSLRRESSRPEATINPNTAESAGISDGDTLTVQTRHGATSFRAVVSEKIHPCVVSVEHGWWFPEKPGPEHGIWDSNANLLTSSAPPYDPAFGSYRLRDIPCRITGGRL